MAEVGIAASIVTLLQLAGSALSHLREVKDAPRECKTMITEVSIIRGILGTIEEMVADANDDTWAASMMTLDDKDGLFDLTRDTLKELQTTLDRASSSRMFKLVPKRIIWPYTKKDAQALLARLGRQKSLLTLALQSDHIQLSREVKTEVLSMRKEISSLNTEISKNIDAQTGMSYFLYRATDSAGQNSSYKPISRAIDYLKVLR
jgi:hypothetical protein